MNSQEQDARLPSRLFMSSIISKLAWIGLFNFTCSELCLFFCNLICCDDSFMYV